MSKTTELLCTLTDGMSTLDQWHISDHTAVAIVRGQQNGVSQRAERLAGQEGLPKDNETLHQVDDLQVVVTPCLSECVFVTVSSL